MEKLLKKILALIDVLRRLKSKRKFDYLIGIDPGVSGGICIYSFSEKRVVELMNNPLTRKDWIDLMSNYGYLSPYKSTAFVEKVQGLPKMSGSGMFTFGENFSNMMNSLACNEIPVVDVIPSIWTKYYSLGTTATKAGKTAWKNKLKNKAQQLYPYLKITLQTADAVLIMNYGLDNLKKNGR